MDDEAKGKFSPKSRPIVDANAELCLKKSERQTVAGAEDVEIVDYHEETRMKKLKPATPGELLREDFWCSCSFPITASRRRLTYPQRIGDVIAAKRSITADTDLRLCRFFGLSNGHWLRARAAHDVEVAEAAMSKQLAKIKPWTGSAA